MPRSVPNSKEAEQAVLSAMFLSKNAQDVAFETLDESAFYYDNNRKIYLALRCCVSGSKKFTNFSGN